MAVAAQTDERCRRCGAILSRYRAAGDELCAPCARRSAEERPAIVLDPERLLYAVAGLLLLARGLDPERRVYLRAELAGYGVDVTNVDVRCAVQKLRRRGMEVEAEERAPGHRLIGWTYRFRRRRRVGGQLQLICDRQARLPVTVGRRTSDKEILAHRENIANSAAAPRLARLEADGGR